MRSSSGDDDGRLTGGRDRGANSWARALWMFCALLGVATFVVLAREVMTSGPITAFDARYLAMRHSLATPFGIRFFLAFTMLGSPVLLTGLSLIVAGGLAASRRRDLTIGWVSAFAGAALIVQTAKRTIQHPRPAGAAQYLHGVSFSFPSGHVVGSVVGFGMLAYVLSRLVFRGHWSRRVLYLLAASMIAMIAWSRIYLGVHFVSDVVGGIAIGGAWLILCILGTEWLCKHHADERDRFSRM